METRNPQLLPDGRIDCEVKLNGVWVPYTADSNDSDPRSFGKTLHAALKNDAKLVYPETPTIEDQIRAARAKRNLLLRQSDWSQLPDVPEAIKSKYAEYRRQLRNLPLQPGFPSGVAWPTEP